MSKPPRVAPPASRKPEARESTLPSAAPTSRGRNFKGSPDSAGPQTGSQLSVGARISRRAADRLRSGHLWVYASDIESIAGYGQKETGAEDAPALVPVADNRGLLLGTALYSPTSQIALRLVSRQSIGGKPAAAQSGR